MSLVPWDAINGEASPFVQIFSALGLPIAADVLNVVVITAAISAINADTFSAGRMLFGLAHHGQASKSFAKVSHNGVPWLAVTVMGIALSVGAVLNALIPEKVFAVVASLATFATIWVWLMILLSHIRMRQNIERQGLPESKFKSPGWPVASWLAVAFVVFIFGLMAWFPLSRSALVVGIVWLIILGVFYWVRQSRV